jgi:hypothetical protein
MLLRNANLFIGSQRSPCVHFCDVGIGFCDDGQDLLEFDVANGGTVIINGRYIFCCATKIDGEWFTDQVLCLNYVDSVDYHASPCDEW